MRDIIPADSSNTFVRKLDVGALTVTNARFPALQSGPHAHARPMCTLTLDGRWTQRLGGREHLCDAGTLLAKDAGETHVDRFDAPGLEVLMIELDLGRGEHLRACVRSLLQSRTIKLAGLEHLARRVVRELSDPDELSAMVIEGLSLELLGTAARSYPTRGASDPPHWLEHAKEILSSPFEKPPRLCDVARELGIHPVRLTRAFRTFVGISPGGFVRKARLERAAIELVASDRPLAEIALWAGFADQSHFTRAFKRYAGFTPHQYRKASRSRRPQNHQT